MTNHETLLNRCSRYPNDIYCGPSLLSKPSISPVPTLRLILTGLSAFAPIIHASRLFPIEQLNKQSRLPYHYMEGGILLLGAMIYGARLPERIYPGKFDIWGCSHQILHVLVVLATFIHLLGVLDAFTWNYENRRCETGGW